MSPETASAFRRMEETRRAIEAYAAENLRRAGDSRCVVLHRTDRGRIDRVTITPSARKPGHWQLTWWDDQGPWGHNDFRTREAAIRSISGQSAEGLPLGGRNWTVEGGAA